MRRTIWKGLSIAFGLLAGCPALQKEPTDYTGQPADYKEDNDGDGYTVYDRDCDDEDAAVNPDATEVCDDLIDNDCDNDVDAEDEDCPVK